MVASHTPERGRARAEHSAVRSANQTAHPPPCAKAALTLLLGIVSVVGALPEILRTTLFVMVLLLTVTSA